MKILYFNNVPTEILWKQWQDGISPSHHLWGMPQLRQMGTEVELMPTEAGGMLGRLGERYRWIKELSQQLRVLRSASQFDVLYCGCQHGALLLGLLRWMGWLKVPVVVTMHHMVHPVFRNRWMFKACFGSFSGFACLHQRVARELADVFSVPSEKIAVVEWGVDSEFYQASNSVDASSVNTGRRQPLVVSAGRTFRDFGVLIRALKDSNIPLDIFCTQDSRPDDEVSQNITIHAPVYLASTHSLLAAYREARVVAIPMISLPQKLIGLTSLLDAMALGKPVVMTRNECISIDIEQEGIGTWIDVGDEEGWRQAISRLLSDPALADNMGQRALLLAQGRYHINTFAAQLDSALRRFRKCESS